MCTYSGLCKIPMPSAYITNSQGPLSTLTNSGLCFNLGIVWQRVSNVQDNQTDDHGSGVPEERSRNPLIDAQPVEMTTTTVTTPTTTTTTTPTTPSANFGIVPARSSIVPARRSRKSTPYLWTTTATLTLTTTKQNIRYPTWGPFMSLLPGCRFYKESFDRNFSLSFF